MKQLFSEIPALQGERVLLKRITQQDADSLQRLVDDEEVYRYLPTFLYEKKYPEIRYVIDHLYDECLEESLILGIFMQDEFCGLVEMYGYRESVHSISFGCRLLRECRGRGAASEALELIAAYLFTKTDVEIITASTLVENTASASVLRKNGFERKSHAVEEDWGYEKPAIADKWVRYKYNQKERNGTMNKEQIWAIHNDIPAEQMPAWKSRRIKAYGEGMMLVENVFAPGETAADHSHPHTQIMYIIEGKTEVTVDGETRTLTAGDSVYVRPDAVHGLRALEETRMLDIFSPMREDFLQ